MTVTIPARCRPAGTRRTVDRWTASRCTGLPTEAGPLFIQIIQGTCRDPEGLRQQIEMWRQKLGPTAQGWLGGTYGVTDEHTFVAMVRLESKEAAARNSTRPEQRPWWAQTERCCEGQVTLHDCDNAMTFLPCGAENAGFVQVIRARLVDPERFRRFMQLPMGLLQQTRPEIIGPIIAIEPDGTFTEAIAFRSQDAARSERKEIPAEMRQEWADAMT